MMTDENDIVIEPVEDDAPAVSKETPSVIDTEPVFEEPSMPDETAVSPPRSPVDPNPVSQRRGCVLLFFGAILGAIMGTVLTLSILLGLNGSLTFASTDAQLRRAINDTRIEQEDMINELATRSAQLEAIATQVGGVAADQAAVTEALSTADAEMEAVVGAVTAVDAQVSELDDRIETTEGQIEGVVTAAAEFDAFLGGLRELLFDEATATPTIKETITGQTPTASAAEASDEVTPDAATTSEATRTVRPTRTPRPTTTPLPLATETSEP